MDAYIISTKLRVPPQAHHRVDRARLVEALEDGVRHYKLVTVTAPAGYGKTTLLTHWAHARSVPVVWLSLDEDDNDLDRFFRYLLSGWEQLSPEVRESSLGLLLRALAPEREAVLTAFINVANSLSDHLVFVLDDYHLIHEPAIHASLTFLLDHLPPTLHFVLAGRGEPPLPLARYRARHELLEVRSEHLSFSTEETDRFLNDVMRLDLAPNEIASVHGQLEGWIAGLQLMALALGGHRVGSEQLIVSGRHRFIADYLSEDVLAHLPEEIRRFLLHTSLLDRLCGSLCDEVTGRDDGQEMLGRLERANLFLVPLDDSREWFRYHRLFGDFLQTELRRREPEEVASIHRRAARWHLDHDLPEPAVRHAVASEDVDLVLQIFKRHFYAKLLAGEFAVLKRWLDALPAEWFSTYPLLDIARVGLLLNTGAVETGIRILDEIEQRLRQADNQDVRRQLSSVMAFRCFVACFQNDLTRAVSFADQALRDLPEEELTFRHGIYGALGDTYARNGRWEDAHASYLRVLDFGNSPTSNVESVHHFGALADLNLRQGRLREASAYWRNALTVIQDQSRWGVDPLPVIGWVYIRMGEVLYEWNDLTDAWSHLSSGLKRAELSGDVRALISGYLLASRVMLTEGDIEAAGHYLERAHPLVEAAQFHEWTSRFERYQIELWLAQNRVRAAVNWTDEMLASDAFQNRPEPEVAQLAVARVLIHKGDSASVRQALNLLGLLRRSSADQGRMGVEIEALALESLACWRRGEQADALTALERALRLAEDEGYVRLFADLGLPIVRLLQFAHARDVMPDYTAKLLLACGAGLESLRSTVPEIPEPLTDREREILGLVAAGLTNSEIADRLSISPQTVKKHTGNIYGKLAVRGRTEAVARARALDLLS